MSFEESLAALEAIIAKMESGSMPLDQAIDCFKKGTELIRQCDAQLNQYEKLITAVTQGADGQVREEETE